MTFPIDTLAEPYRVELGGCDLAGATWEPLTRDGEPDGVRVILADGETMTLRQLACIDGPDGCRGAVTLWWPGYGAKRYPRCERHGQARVDRELAHDNPDSPCAPDGFDPADAGERWDDE